jgi:hypothetical protein
MTAGKNSDAQLEPSFILRPIVGLVECLPKVDLEQITIEAIKTHRCLRDIAEERYEAWRTGSSSNGETAGPARIAYVTAMIDVHAQQTVLSTLLEVLGHIPLVPKT